MKMKLHLVLLFVCLVHVVRSRDCSETNTMGEPVDPKCRTSLSTFVKKYTPWVFKWLFDEEGSESNSITHMMPKAQQRSIYWFRKALRLHDNPALLEAVDGVSEFYPVFILDPRFVSNGTVGGNRWRFLQQSLENTDSKLKELNSRLFVLRGSPKEMLRLAFIEWKITRLAFEVDTEPYAKQRDDEIEAMAREFNITVVKRVSHTLYDTNEAIRHNNGTPPMTYQRLQTVLREIGLPARPTVTLSKEHLSGILTPAFADHEELYAVPTLQELNVDESELMTTLYPGGETEALARLQRFLQDKTQVCQFSKPDTSPNSLEPSTTVLSPYLKFGCLSVRQMYWSTIKVYEGCKKYTLPPVSLLGQLLWREFFYTAAAGTPNFDRMEGNPICQQISWDDNKRYLDAWENGKTGYPFIDAAMIQLKQEGWIHHLARHAVACFLTRGDLWVSWEQGKDVFEKLLLDADWSLNAGNWMWMSASAFFHQYYRVYSPVTFGKKTDKNGDYIRKYIPKLANYPAEYIYEPWIAPASVQEKAGCVIGRDYPNPIVDHEDIKKVNMGRMKSAYAASRGQVVDDEEQVQGSGIELEKKSVPAKRVQQHKQNDLTQFLTQKRTHRDTDTN